MKKFLILATVLVSSLAFGQNRIIEGDIALNLKYEKNFIINSEAEKSATQGIISTMGITARTSATANVLSGIYSYELTSTNPGQTFTASSTALVGVGGKMCEGSFKFKFGSTTVPFTASVLSGSTVVASGTLTNMTGSIASVNKMLLTFPCIDGVKPSLQTTSTASSATKLYQDKLFIGVSEYSALIISGTVIDFGASQSFTKTLSANTTFTFANAVAGSVVTIRLTNTASNYTVTWPTIRWATGAAPVMTLGAKSDVYTILYDGANFYGSAVQDMY